jgi:hypothetical protein
MQSASVTEPAADASATRIVAEPEVRLTTFSVVTFVPDAGAATTAVHVVALETSTFEYTPEAMGLSLFTDQIVWVTYLFI